MTKRRAETRQRLLDAALEVFAERGFGSTSVEHVCERAGYTRGAFYSNFVSLDQLFLAMWEQRSAATLEAAAAALAAASRDEVTSLEDGIDRLLAVIDVDETWFRIQSEFTAHALRVPGLRGVIAAREQQIADTLLPYLDRAVDQVGRRIVDRDAFAAALIAVHDGTIAQCLLEPEDAEVWRRRRALFLTVVDAYTQEESS